MASSYLPKALHNYSSAEAAAAAQGGEPGFMTGTIVLDEIDEDNQPLIEEIANKALNQTADHISFGEVTANQSATKSTFLSTLLSFPFMIPLLPEFPYSTANIVKVHVKPSG
jgi:hypothetical protein